MKKAQRIRRSQAQWRKIFAQFEASSLTAAAFCKQQGIAYGSFMRWQQRFAIPTCREAQASADDWLPIQVATDAKDDSPTTQGWDIELALPGGVQLRMRAL